MWKSQTCENYKGALGLLTQITKARKATQNKSRNLPGRESEATLGYKMCAYVKKQTPKSKPWDKSKKNNRMSEEHLLLGKAGGGPSRRPRLIHRWPSYEPANSTKYNTSPLSQSGSLPTRDPWLETGMNWKGHLRKGVVVLNSVIKRIHQEEETADKSGLSWPLWEITYR